MFFVDDDQAEGLDRREDRRASANHDIHFSTSDAVPLVVTLAVRQAAVLNGHPLSERGSEDRRDRRSERNFRHEHQDAAAGSLDQRGEAQIQLGLSAPGDAMKQHRPECAL